MVAVLNECVAQHDSELNVYYCKDCDGILRSPNVRSQCRTNRFTREMLRERINQKKGIPSGSSPKLKFKRHPEPGTELTKLLSKVGVKYKAECSCKDKAAAMNTRGVDWCRKNIELIVDWLAAEAKNRKLPFMRLAGKALVKIAIWKSIRAATAKVR
tara:strand:+ start:933 stop:1403 length:471 start_codon:yes stop_codon:yes gene_type:complete